MGELTPLVSIVITNYNYLSYIGECLHSCLLQTYPNIEVVVVDDASTDRSVGLVKEFQEVHKNLILVEHEENLGYAAAKNSGILLSEGEYVRMLDADDILTPTAVEDAMKIMVDRPDVDLVHGAALRWYGGNDLRGYNKKTYVHAQGRLWRRSVFDRFGLYFEPLKSMADKEFVYRLGVHPLSSLPRLVNDKKIKTVVAWYRKHETQMHRVRKTKNKPLNTEVKRIFKSRIKKLQREGVTRKNTRFP